MPPFCRWFLAVGVGFLGADLLIVSFLAVGCTMKYRCIFQPVKNRLPRAPQLIILRRGRRRQAGGRRRYKGLIYPYKTLYNFKTPGEPYFIRVSANAGGQNSAPWWTKLRALVWVRKIVHLAYNCDSLVVDPVAFYKAILFIMFQ